MKIEFSWHISEKYSNVKFHENPSSGSRVFPCGQTDGQLDGQTSIRNFANVHKNTNKVHKRKFELLSLSEVEIRRIFRGLLPRLALLDLTTETARFSEMSTGLDDVKSEKGLITCSALL